MNSRKVDIHSSSESGVPKSIKDKYPHCSFCGLLIILMMTCCVFRSTMIESVSKERLQGEKTYVIESPTKVHLYDGSLIIYDNGFEVRENKIFGSGLRWDLTRTTATPITTFSMDSVVSLECYITRIEQGPLHTSAPPVTVASVLGTRYLFKMIFGSCPTVYSFDGENYVFESESFSYSIAKKLENNDLDRLDYGKAINGVYSIKVKNEALETHYINYMAMVAIDHPTEYEVLPSEKNRIVLFGKINAILEAKSKKGADVKALIGTRDNLYYESDQLSVKELTHNITRDWIECKTVIPEETHKMYVALRLRNTLLNTVLFYDVMLRSLGFKAIDWLGSQTSNLFYAWHLSNWYKKNFGLHIELYDKNRFTEEVWIKDTGPIAWHQVAVELPVPDADTARLRFAFLPDNVVIDWIGISFDQGESYTATTISCDEIFDAKGDRVHNGVDLISKKDGSYLITYPGDSYILNFKIGKAPAGQKRTYLLASRGFYIEWLRKEWLVQNTNQIEKRGFGLNDKSINRAAQLWIAKKDDFTKDFYESKFRIEGAK